MSKRLVGTLLAAILAAVLAGPVAARQESVQTRAVLAIQLLDEINAVRTAEHLPVLRPAPALARAAGDHTREMARLGYFAHESADGTRAWRRVARWYSPQGREFWSIGENLLWTAPVLTPHEMVARWLASPEHRTVLLDPTWREVGIYAARAPAAPGVYAGQAVTIVTADFGARH